MQAAEVILQATDRIVFVVGGNHIVIDRSGITISGHPVVDINPPGASSPARPSEPLAPADPPKPKPKQPKPAR
jgi:hypothetical protein